MTHEMMIETLCAIKGIGPKRARHIVEAVENAQTSMLELARWPVDDLSAYFKVPQNIAVDLRAWLRDHASENAIEAPEAASTPAKRTLPPGIHQLDQQSASYPQRLRDVLGNAAPPVLYVWGNLSLLNPPAIGFCGARKATEKGLVVTQDIADQVAHENWIVVSGHAKGVDLAAHQAAVNAGSGTIIVLPQGILKFKLDPQLKQMAAAEQLLVISQFDPDTEWDKTHALQRNLTILALSDAMIMVEARSTGGTFAAGNAALQLNHPLYVVSFQEVEETREGNAYFIEQGAHPILKSRSTGRANLDPLRQTVNAAFTSPAGG